MSRSKAAEQAFGKALTLWEAPEGAGEARVCLASTFTFDAAFFETECLGRFLGMDSHPSESEAVSYMVEREEKLAAASVAVLADRRHAREKESLRWDVLGVLAPRGAKQHAKISLLAWANHVRVIIGSGNLTEPGYRSNLEVFGAIDLDRKDGGDRELLGRVLDFLDELVSAAVGGEAPESPKPRAREALRAVRRQVAGWPQVAAANPVLVLGGPGRAVLPQLAAAWRSGSPPRSAYVVSPFFDSDGKDAMGALLEVLAKRRPREICVDVRAETGLDGRTRVFAPLPMMQLAASQAELTVRRVLADQRGERRELHAKLIYLANDDWCATLAGSSNFTSAGLGAGRTPPNFEANLAWCVRAKDPEAKVLDEVWPEFGDELDIESDQLIWEPVPEEQEEGGQELPLPAAFEEASFVPGSPAALAITLRDPLPKTWNIRVPGGREILSSARAGSGEHHIAWEGTEVPFVLEVAWSHLGGTALASWPVNVSNPAALPPPEALRSLTLEELLQVLASTRPMPQAVAEVLNKRQKKKAEGDADLDPLRRFDSQSFLLRRTKRLATALERMRERLERPASSREAFDWRLFGPVGPLALAEGYAREATFAGEAKFCLAEIALALHRVAPARVAVDGLPVAQVKESLKKAIAQLREKAAQLTPAPELDRYATAAFEEAAS
jgi:hypothetical protein